MEQPCETEETPMKRTILVIATLTLATLTTGCFGPPNAQRDANSLALLGILANMENAKMGAVPTLQTVHCYPNILGGQDCRNF